MELKLALPKGRLQEETARLLEAAKLGLEGYHAGSRSYRPRSSNLPGLLVKVFQEKDIPIQIAVGNYDLGICGQEWIEELLARYPSSALVKVKDLGYGRRNLYAVVSDADGVTTLEETRSYPGIIRIVSEFPNLAEAMALRLRLPRFRIFPVWGAAEVYPPEDAELAIIPEASSQGFRYNGLRPLTSLLSGTAYLIANRHSWETKDLSPVLAPLSQAKLETTSKLEEPERRLHATYPTTGTRGTLRIALPDGHQQRPTLEFLERAGIKLKGYRAGHRRPESIWDGVSIKVIRPQDMPLQVACGHFDMAITGRDWLQDHLSRFPSSPATELGNLGFGRVRVVAVVSEKLPVNNIRELRELFRGDRPIRVASEYVNLADKYARDNHLGPYRVIPTWGASEAFLPEDADLLIENTETGKTLAQHHLKIIDTLFESSACIIGNPDHSQLRSETAAHILALFARATEANR